MPGYRIETQGNIATLTVPCLNNETHQFSVRWGNQPRSPYHSYEDDLVILGLGGAPHPCNLVAVAYEIAQISYAASVGISDVPNLKFLKDKGYRSESRCGLCKSKWTDLAHLSGVEHLCDTYGLPQLKQLTKSFRTWMFSNTQEPVAYTSEQQILSAYPAFQRQTTVGTDAYTYPDGTTFTTASLLLTPQYINQAIKLAGPQLRKIIELRASGITLNWIKEATAGIAPNRLAEIKNGTSQAALIGARNLPPLKVNEYFTAGVYTNMYTYEKAGASPEIAGRVKAATKGRITLADVLDDGHTLEDAEKLAIFHENFNRS